MYRRRYQRSAAPRGRFRRRPLARPATRVGAQRWQWGNVFAQTTVQGSGAGLSTTNVLFELASLEPNHFNDPNLPNNAGIIQGITQSNMIKAIDIGGIVFDSGIHQSSQSLAAAGLTASKWWTMQTILLDKKDAVSGIPASTNANYAVSTFPSNVVDFTLPRPSSLQEIRDYPSRILYRSCDYVNPGLQVQPTPDSDLLASRVRQEVLNPQRHRSLRVKRRLTDDWGLYAGFHVWNGGNVPAGLVFTAWFSASIYYRIVW